MSELFKGPALGLACFLLVNVTASGIALLLARLSRQAWAKGSALRREHALFVLRLFPAMTSLVALGLFFVPAYLVHEPVGTGERVGVPLLALAASACLVLASAMRRGLRTWSETRQLARSWGKGAQSIDIGVAGLPAYRIAHRFPMVSVVGVFRPRLFVSDQVLSALEQAELAAVLDHELAHAAARDNLRHWLVRVCPDVLAWLHAGGRLARAWLAAAEEAADERAVRGRPAAALTLAEALIKVARLVPPDRPHLVPGLALHKGDDLARRVERLLCPPPPPVSRRSQRPMWLLTGLILLLALALYAPALRGVHELTERLLAILS